jgi:hypothetical protein
MEEPKWKFYVAGVSFHEAQHVLHELEVDDELVLDPEPSNIYDSNAVRILYENKDGKETMLGYVPKKISAEVSAFLEYESEPLCIISEVTPSAKTWNQIEVAIGGREDA